MDKTPAQVLREILEIIENAPITYEMPPPCEREPEGMSMWQHYLLNHPLGSETD